MHFTFASLCEFLFVCWDCTFYYVFKLKVGLVCSSQELDLHVPLASSGHVFASLASIVWSGLEFIALSRALVELDLCIQLECLTHMILLWVMILYSFREFKHTSLHTNTQTLKNSCLNFHDWSSSNFYWIYSFSI